MTRESLRERIKIGVWPAAILLLLLLFCQLTLAGCGGAADGAASLPPDGAGTIGESLPDVYKRQDAFFAMGASADASEQPAAGEEADTETRPRPEEERDVYKRQESGEPQPARARSKVAVSSKAVSYTHLDVYKRQSLIFLITNDQHTLIFK